MTGEFGKTRRALLAMLAGGTVVMLGCHTEPDSAVIGPGAPFPRITSFESLEGRITDQPAGEALVVNFWATWCGPCRTEMPALQQLDDHLRGRGIRVVAVSIDRDRNLAREFIRSARIRFPVYFDPNGAYSNQKLGLRTLPETFLVDAAGIIRARISGSRDWSSPSSVRMVTDQLQGRRSGDVAYRGGWAPN